METLVTNGLRRNEVKSYFSFALFSNISFRSYKQTPFPTKNFLSVNFFVYPRRHFFSKSAYTDTLSPFLIPKVETASILGSLI